MRALISTHLIVEVENYEAAVELRDEADRAAFSNLEERFKVSDAFGPEIGAQVRSMIIYMGTTLSVPAEDNGT